MNQLARPASTGPRHLASIPKSAVAIALSWAAGFVDTAGWLVLNHVYTSHMTGNTANLAHAVYLAKWNEAWSYGWPIVPFVLGLLYSAGTTRAARRSGLHSSFSIALITECALLGIVAARGDSSFWAVTLLAAAMGIQTVTVTRINGLRVFTTYLTGSLTKLSEAAIDYAFWFYDRTRGRGWKRLARVLSVSGHRVSLQHTALIVGLWSGFFAGAYCGVAVELRIGLAALVAPIAVLGVTIAVDLWSPVAAADEPVEKASAH